MPKNFAPLAPCCLVSPDGDGEVSKYVKILVMDSFLRAIGSNHHGLVQVPDPSQLTIRAVNRTSQFG